MPRRTVRPAVAALLLVLACDGRTEEPASERVAVDAPAPGAARARSADALADLDRTLAAVLRRAEAQPRSWLALETAAGLYLDRARLTGDYDDYARAEATLERAAAVAPPGAGPVWTRVRLDFTLHRLGRVAADLDVAAGWAIQTPEHRRALAAARAELAFQQGRYADAAAGYQAGLAAADDADALTARTRLALYRCKTGDFAGAEELYREALADLPGEGGEPAAWLHLQLGLLDLDRGRHAEALAHYRDAEAQLSGHWLIDEHIAEITALQGRVDEALALYADIIARTDNPEFMDAAAALHRAAGREDAARPLIARAAAIYEEQLARFPEAASGHALAHFLEFGEDPARTVAIAEANHRTRPNAEAKIALARAYLGAGRATDARAAIEAALATPWETAELHAVAAAVFAAAGDPARSAAERARAVSIDPHALE